MGEEERKAKEEAQRMGDEERKAKEEALRKGEEERKAKEEAIKGRKKEKKRRQEALKEAEDEREAKEILQLEKEAEEQAKEEALREMIEAEHARDDMQRDQEWIISEKDAAMQKCDSIRKEKARTDTTLNELRTEVHRLSKKMLPYTIYWLDSVPLHLYTSHVRKDGNVITHFSWGLSTFIVGKPMTSVCTSILSPLRHSLPP